MSSETHRILIAEDDPLTGHIFKGVFERAGFEVEVASDGEALLERFEEYDPHVLVLDILMPRMNGVQVVKKIRETLRGHKVPIIVLTNVYIPTFQDVAVQAGANMVFDKASVKPEWLVEAVKQLVNPTVLPVCPRNEQPCVDEVAGSD